MALILAPDLWSMDGHISTSLRLLRLILASNLTITAESLLIHPDGNAPLLSSLSRDLDGMGEITVEAFYVKDSHRDDRTGNDLNDRFRTMGKIPEKALKGTALSHQTT